MVFVPKMSRLSKNWTYGLRDAKLERLPRKDGGIDIGPRTRVSTSCIRLKGTGVIKKSSFFSTLMERMIPRPTHLVTLKWFRTCVCVCVLLSIPVWCLWQRKYVRFECLCLHSHNHVSMKCTDPQARHQMHATQRKEESDSHVKHKIQAIEVMYELGVRSREIATCFSISHPCSVSQSSYLDMEQSMKWVVVF